MAGGLCILRNTKMRKILFWFQGAYTLAKGTRCAHCKSEEQGPGPVGVCGQKDSTSNWWLLGLTFSSMKWEERTRWVSSPLWTWISNILIPLVYQLNRTENFIKEVVSVLGKISEWSYWKKKRRTCPLGKKKNISTGGSGGKESAYNAGDQGSIPRSARSPGERNGNPFQYSCLENSMDRGAWRATVRGVTKSQTLLSG